MDALAAYVAGVQRVFIERQYGSCDEYIQTGPAGWVDTHRASLDVTLHENFGLFAREQVKLHDAVRQLFGTPASSLQREDDLFLILQVVSLISKKGVAPIVLGKGGLIWVGDQRVLVGTAPIRRFNAFVTSVPDSSDVAMLFDDELAIALSRLARSLSDVISLGPDGPRLLSDDSAVASGRQGRHFLGIGSLLLSMVTSEDSREAATFEISTEFFPIHSLVASIALQFVALHELAHLTLHHLKPGCALLAAVDGLDVRQWCVAPQREFEADREAIRHLLALSHEAPLEMVGAAAALPLALFAAIDTLLLLCSDRFQDPGAVDFDVLAYCTATHPSPMLRLTNLKASASTLGSPAFWSGYDACIELVLTAAQRAARMVRESPHFSDFSVHARWTPNVHRMRQSGTGR